MALDFKIYNLKGDCLNRCGTRYVCFDVFLRSDTHHLGSTCVIHQDNYLEHIDNWTCDDSNKLWKDYFSQHPMIRDDTQLCSYFNKDEIQELVSLLDGDLKETFLDIVRDEQGIIVQIW